MSPVDYPSLPNTPLDGNIVSSPSSSTSVDYLSDYEGSQVGHVSPGMTPVGGIYLINIGLEVVVPPAQFRASLTPSELDIPT